MDIVALVISIFATVFAGIVAYLAFREQRLRLRAQIYVDGILTEKSGNELVIKYKIGNSGLLVAKNVVVSLMFRLDDKEPISVDKEYDSSAIIMPSQTCWTSVKVTGRLPIAMQSIIDGSVRLFTHANIEYESNNKKHYYNVVGRYNPQSNSWGIVDGDAN